VSRPVDGAEKFADDARGVLLGEFLGRVLFLVALPTWDRADRRTSESGVAAKVRSKAIPGILLEADRRY
jgi:hypothetical protein